MEKPVSLFAAYRMVCENSNKADALMRKNIKSKTVTIDGDESRKTVLGQGGAVTDRYERTSVEKHPNTEYSDKILVSPFYKSSSTCNAKSGIFAQDLTSVEAALKQGVSSNHMVQSKLIPLGYDTHGTYDEPVIDLGLVDALIWQCIMGNDQNVRVILKYGYKPMKRYSGLNPITAAIRGKNLQCLKLVLAVPEIRNLVNDKDGFGGRAIQCVAEIPGIDPYEFAREVVKAGGVDSGYRDGQYSALMLCLLRRGGGAIWTPNVFGEILPVSDLNYKSKDGETVVTLAKKVNNQDALRMIMNYQKFGEESLNPAILNNGIAF